MAGIRPICPDLLHLKIIIKNVRATFRLLLTGVLSVLIALGPWSPALAKTKKGAVLKDQWDIRPLPWSQFVALSEAERARHILTLMAKMYFESELTATLDTQSKLSQTKAKSPKKFEVSNSKVPKNKVVEDQSENTKAQTAYTSLPTSVKLSFKDARSQEFIRDLRSAVESIRKSRQPTDTVSIQKFWWIAKTFALLAGSPAMADAVAHCRITLPNDDRVLNSLRGQPIFILKGDHLNCAEAVTAHFAANGPLQSLAGYLAATTPADDTGESILAEWRAVAPSASAEEVNLNPPDYPCSDTNSGTNPQFNAQAAGLFYSVNQGILSCIESPNSLRNLALGLSPAQVRADFITGYSADPSRTMRTCPLYQAGNELTPVSCSGLGIQTWDQSSCALAYAGLYQNVLPDSPFRLGYLPPINTRPDRVTYCTPPPFSRSADSPLGGFYSNYGALIAIPNGKNCESDLPKMMADCLKETHAEMKNAEGRCTENGYRKEGSACVFGLVPSTYSDQGPSRAMACQAPMASDAGPGTLPGGRFRCPSFGLTPVEESSSDPFEVELFASGTKVGNLSERCADAFLAQVNAADFIISQKDYDRLVANFRAYYRWSEIGCGLSLSDYCSGGNVINTNKQAEMCRQLGRIKSWFSNRTPATDGTATHSTETIK